MVVDIKTYSGKHGGRFYEVDPEKKLCLPSVTTIMNEMSDKSWLSDWESRIGKEEAAKKSAYSANRGTYMHYLNEMYLDLKYTKKESGDLIEKALQLAKENEAFKDFTLEQIDGGVDLFFKFLNTGTFDRLSNVVIQEVPLWSMRGGGYAGRVDLIANNIVKRLLVIDFKSAGKPKAEQWIEGYKKQIAAYSIAYYERYGEIPYGGEIWIANEATSYPQIFTMDFNDIKKYFAIFIEQVKGYHAKYPNYEIDYTKSGV